MKDILTIKEVAERLQVSERTVSDWAQKGEIPCGKLGNSWRFKRSDIDRWLDKKLSSGRVETEPADLVVADVLPRERILFLDVSRKRHVLDALIDCLSQSHAIASREELAAEIYHREELMSTGIGLGVAIPHVRLSSLDRVVMAAAVSRRDLDDYDSLDALPVRMVFMIATGRHQHALYLRLLSNLAKRVKDEATRERLLHAGDAQAFLSILSGS